MAGGLVARACCLAAQLRCLHGAGRSSAKVAVTDVADALILRELFGAGASLQYCCVPLLTCG